MKINPELKQWFIEKLKIHIINGVKDFKKNDWYGGGEQTTMDFYEDFKYQFDHIVEMQKCGSSHVVDWFNNFDCPIKERNTEEMMHLMSQVRDGAISYKMIFQEKK